MESLAPDLGAHSGLFVEDIAWRKYKGEMQENQWVTLPPLEPLPSMPDESMNTSCIWKWVYLMDAVRSLLSAITGTCLEHPVSRRLQVNQ